MANLFFGVTGPTLDLRQDLQIADTDAPRIIAYLMASSYGQVTENVQSTVPNPAWSADQPDPNDPPEFIEVQQWVTRPATPEETAANYARAVLADLLNQTVAHEKAQAAKEAAEGVAPIEPVA